MSERALRQLTSIIPTNSNTNKQKVHVLIVCLGWFEAPSTLIFSGSIGEPSHRSVRVIVFMETK